MFPALKKFHRLSGIAIAGFLLLHLVNHLFALGGPSMHIAVMKLFRYVYSFPPVEIILLIFVVFQIASGVMLAFKKGFLKQPIYVVIQVCRPPTDVFGRRLAWLGPARLLSSCMGIFFCPKKNK